MNDQHPDERTDAFAEPDAIERQWMGILAEHDDAWSNSEDAFVQGVMDQLDEDHAELVDGDAPAVVGRIGLPFKRLHYAAAAALLFAAVIGGYLLITNAGSLDAPQADPDQFATPGEEDQESTNTPQPPAKPLQLGQLIAQTQAVVTKPDPDLPGAINQTRQSLQFERLLEWVSSPLPDLNEVLEPLKPKGQQSRV